MKKIFMFLSVLLCSAIAFGQTKKLLISDADAEKIKVAIGIAAILIVLYLVHVFKRRQRVKKYSLRIEQEIIDARRTFQGVLDAASTFPDWAKKEAEEHRLQGETLLDDAQLFLTQAQQCHKKRKFVASLALLSRSHNAIEKAFVLLVKIIGDTNSVKAKVVSLDSSAKTSLGRVQILISDALAYLNELSYRKYAFTYEQKQHELYREQIQALSQKLTDRNALKAIYETVRIIEDQSKESVIKVKAIVSAQEEIATALDSGALDGLAIEARNMVRDAIGLFVEYRQKYTPAVYQQQYDELHKCHMVLESNNLSFSVQKITVYNSLTQRQNLSLAASLYNDLLNTIVLAKKTAEDFAAIEQKQDNAKQIFEDRKDFIEDLVSGAMKEVKHPYVSKETKTKAKEAQILLNRINLLANMKGLNDWVASAAMLDSLEKGASSVMHKKIEYDSNLVVRRKIEQRHDTLSVSSGTYNAFMRTPAKEYKSSFSQVIVNDDPVGIFVPIATTPETQTGFAGFGGGTSDGAGATDSW